MPLGIGNSAVWGTSGPGAATGNATVPTHAPIQPPQAYVDFWGVVYDIFESGGLDFSEIPSLRTVETGWLIPLAAWNDDAGPFSISFAGCSLDQSSVDNLLSTLANSDWVGQGATLDLSGGTNAAPSLANGHGEPANPDVTTLVDNGWTVLHN